MGYDPVESPGHVLVCGLYGVALRTVEQLHLAGIPVTVLADNDDPRLIAMVQSWGIPLRDGSPRLAETLEKAGIRSASAVVCTLEDDLHTLETALLARELRSDVRVVAQIRNPAVGRALGDVQISVLDVAGLTAPAVVESCLRTESHDLFLGGERFTTATSVADRAGTLRDIFGDLAPVAVVPSEYSPHHSATPGVVFCPGRDYQVGPGDRVTVIGTPEDLSTAGLASTRSSMARKPAWASQLGTWLASLIRILDRRLIAALVGLLVLVATATAILRTSYQEPDGTRMTVLDALYFSIETIATVGYGDFNFRSQPPALRMFAIVLMVTGAVTVALFFAILTNLFVSRGIAEALGMHLVTALADHVVVVGLGSIGLRVVEQLRATGANVVVIEHKESNRYLAQARACGARVVIADATLRQTLESAAVRQAAAVAVMTSDDLVNLETGLAVRDQLAGRWPTIPVVLRLFDRQLAHTVQRNFGFRYVRSTAELAAPWFVGAVLGLDLLGTFYVADHPLLVGHLTVAAQSGLDGLAMRDLSARTRVVTILRAAREGQPAHLEHCPRRETRLYAGDQVYVIGPYTELLQVLQRDTLSPSQAGSPSTGATGNGTGASAQAAGMGSSY